MGHGDQQFELMLQRAWRAAYDAALMAENQGRRGHMARLKRVCVMVNECQADVWATADAQTPRVPDRTVDRWAGRHQAAADRRGGG
jgi:hypothetical protein